MCNKFKFLLSILLILFIGSKINAIEGTGSLCVQRAAELTVARELLQQAEMELAKRNELVRRQETIRAFFQTEKTCGPVYNANSTIDFTRLAICF